MANRLRQLLGQFHILLDTRRDPYSDGELLIRFTASQDESAFAALVRRHGPLVLGVCRRMLADANDADDAFQVTFLTLARKAAALGPRPSLAGWLYRVAYHVALRVRSNATRRRAQEKEVVPVSRPDPTSEVSWRELRPVLDEEVSRLPEKFRGPVVLCCLEGQTNEEAARRLGWPAGSLSKRLARGRELLRQRLARRGFVLSTAGLVALIGGHATAAVPPTLIEVTIRAALPLAVGATAGVPAHLSLLLEQTMRSLFWTKFKIAAVLLLSVGVLAAAASWALFPGATAEPIPQTQAPPAFDEPHLPDDDPTAWKEWPGDPLPPGAVARLGSSRWRHGSSVVFAGYLAGGEQMVSLSLDGKVHVWDAEGRELRSWNSNSSKDSNFSSYYHIASAALSPDGRTLAVEMYYNPIALERTTAIFFWDVAAGKPHPTVPALGKFDGPLRGMAFTPDGKTLFINNGDARKDPAILTCDLTDADKKVRPFVLLAGKKDTPASASLTLSSDGNYVARGEHHWGKPGTVHVLVWDAKTGEKLSETEDAADGMGNLCFSPNGKEIVWADPSGTVHRFETLTGKKAGTLSGLRKPSAEPFPVAWSSDRLAIAPKGNILAEYYPVTGTTVLRDLTTGRELRRLSSHQFSRRADQPVPPVFSADGSRLALCDDLQIRLLDVAGRPMPGTAPGHESRLVSLAVGPGGRTVTTVDTIGSVRIWETATGKLLREVPLPADSRDAPVWNERCAQLSADGRLLAYVDRVGFVRLWDVANGKERPKGKLLAESPRKDSPDREEIHWGPFLAPQLCLAGNGQTVGYSPGSSDAFGTPETFEGLVLHWDVATGRQLPVIRDPENDDPKQHFLTQPISLISNDGKRLVTAMHPPASPDDPVPDGGPSESRRPPYHSVRSWDPQTGKMLVRFDIGRRNFESMALSPNGKLLATLCTDATIALYEMETGKLRAQIPGSGSLTVFGPDNRTLAVADGAGTVRLLDIVTSKELGRFRGHQGPIRTMAFSSGGRFLVTGSDDTTALVWDVTRLQPRE